MLMTECSALRVGLVLGAGGAVGVAFHAGALRAIRAVTGWNPRTAEVIVGTSAGAQVAALLRAGLDTEDLAAHATGQPVTPEGASILRHYIRPLHNCAHPDHPLRLLPYAPRYILRVARDPRRFCLGCLIASMLPPGRVRLDSQSEGFRRLFAAGWPEEKLWIPAMRLDTGERVVFGRPGAPETDVGSAVTASGAVPGLCVPISIDSRCYVDGCFLSSTHLEVAADAGVDAVVVCSPLSRFPFVRRLVRRSVRRVRASGLPVLFVEPAKATIARMGWNPFALGKVAAVARSAFETTVAFLEHPDQADMRHRLEAASAKT